MDKIDNAIILEGITGSGKSMQVKLISSANPDYCICNNASDIFKTTLPARDSLHKIGLKVIPEAMLHQFTTWMKVYEQCHESAVTIIDRFTLSNLVYFIARCEIENITVDIPKTRQMFLEPYGLSVLDKTHTIYFDCKPEIAARRVSRRAGREDFNIELQSHAYDIYRRELEIYPFAAYIINSGGTVEETSERFMPLLEEIVDKIKNGKV